MNVVKEVEVRLGRNSKVPAKLLVVEEKVKEEKRLYGVKVFSAHRRERKLYVKIGNFVVDFKRASIQPTKLGEVLFLNLTEDEVKQLSKELSKILNRKLKLNPNQPVGFVLTEEAKNAIDQLLKEIEEFNRKEKENAFSSETKLVVVPKYFYDSPYPDLVLVWNKSEPLVEPELKEKFKEIMRYLRRAEGKYLITDAGAYSVKHYVLAPKGLKPGQTLTLKELEELYKDAIEEGKRKYLEEVERRKRAKSNLEEKRRKALEEAKRTGREVIVRVICTFDTDDYESSCYRDYSHLVDDDTEGTVQVVEVATPDGKIVEKAIVYE